MQRWQTACGLAGHLPCYFQTNSFRLPQIVVVKAMALCPILSAGVADAKDVVAGISGSSASGSRCLHGPIRASYSLQPKAAVPGIDLSPHRSALSA